MYKQIVQKVKDNYSRVVEPTSTDELKRYLKDNEKTTDERLQDYYLQLAKEGRRKSDDEEVLKEREILHQNVNEEVKDLKRKQKILLNSYLKTLEQSDETESRLRDIENAQKKSHFISHAPANSVIDLEEKEVHHFASGLNFYKIFLIFFIGSVLGLLAETLYVFIQRGHVASRVGLLYGPFSPIYGVGAVLLSLALYRYRNRNVLLCFLGGMVVGSFLEYFASWGQEVIFGSSSWDYSDMAFNLNGRICLQISLMWGLLGALWMKSIYPRISQWILKIPNHSGKIVSWILVVFMSIDAIMTLGVVTRWSQRVQGIEASNVVEEFIDEHYDNERLEQKFSNMVYK